MDINAAFSVNKTHGICRHCSQLRLLIVMLSLCIAGNITLGEDILTPPDDSRSARRIETITRITRDFYKSATLLASDRRARMRILRSFQAEDPCPNPPSADIISVSQCQTAADKLTESLVLEKHPPVSPDALQAESIQKFPAYEYGDKISVTYLASPVRKVTVSGTYRGKKGGRLMVGSYRIREVDFATLPENKAEIIKFDLAESQRLRNEYISKRKKEIEQARETYRNEVAIASLTAEKQRGIRLNEQNGYIFFNGDWKPLIRVIDTIASTVKENMLEAQKTKEAAPSPTPAPPDAVLEETKPATELTPDTPVKTEIIAPSEQPDNTEEAVEQPAESVPTTLNEQEESSAVPTDTAENQPEKAEENPEETPAAEPKTEETPAAEPASVPTPATAPEELVIESSSPLPLIGLLIIIIAGAAGGYLIIAKRNKTLKILGRFHDGTADGGQDFWPIPQEMADSIPHVAFTFPDREHAVAALKNLSFIFTDDKTDSINCSIEAHAGLAVCETGITAFIAGQQLDYASWREAKTRLSNDEQAQKVAVSIAPIFAVVLPHEDELQEGIQFLDKYDGSDDDFSRYWEYQADSKKLATNFLKTVKVGAPGISIVVKFPKGSFIKTQNGIRTLKD